MGSFNCTGFHSRLPITGGDEVVLILGLHQTPRHTVKYAFDPMVFAPDITFTPIALPIYCKYDDCRHMRDIIRDKNVETLERFFGESVSDILCNCDSGGELAEKLARTINEKFNLPAGEYQLTYTFDHRFVYDEIATMKLPWDWERSYELTLEYSDVSARLENKKFTADEQKLIEISESLPDGPGKHELQNILLERTYYAMDLDRIFNKHNLETGWGHTVANLNPKHVGTSLFRDNEAFSGELLLAIYRYHADVLFHPDSKSSLLSFMNFYQAMRYHNWTLTMPVYAGQLERYEEIAPLYRKMAEWVEVKVEDSEYL